MHWLWNLAVLLLVAMIYNMLGLSGGRALTLAVITYFVVAYTLVWMLLSTD